jgi:hypothetical protein
MSGTSTSEGVTEGIVPVFKDLPSAVHSLENVRYMAARELRSLARGNAFISYVGIEGWKGARVSVPRVQEAQIPKEGGAGARAALFDASPSAVPADRAQALVNEREQQVYAAAATLKSLPAGPRSPRTKASSGGKRDPAPEEPETWRVAAPKRKPKATRSRVKS